MSDAGRTARTLYRDVALADGRDDRLLRGMSLLVEGDRIAWIRPTDAEEDPGPADGLEVVDAVGLTIVPGMVDGHSHFAGAGGAHWMDHWNDAPEATVANAARNAALLTQAGVSSPTFPRTGRRRRRSVAER